MCQLKNTGTVQQCRLCGKKIIITICDECWEKLVEERRKLGEVWKRGKSKYDN